MSLENIVSIHASEIEPHTWAHAGQGWGSIGSREQLRTLAKVRATSAWARLGYWPLTPIHCWRPLGSLEGQLDWDALLRIESCPTREVGHSWLPHSWLAEKKIGRLLGLLGLPEVEVEVGVASSPGGKTSSPPPGGPLAPFPFLVSPHNDADCSTSVIITLCLKIQNKSQERNWCGLSRILLPRGPVVGGWGSREEP